MASGVIFLKFRNPAEYLCAFVFGGVVYGAVETLWRGHTHPTMLFVGGVCFFAMYLMNKRSRPKPWLAAVYGCAVITTAELLSGVVFNLWLGLDVWDYSALPFNLSGQICLRYSFFWAVLSVPAFKMCGLLEKAVTDAGNYSAASEASASENSSSSL